MRQQRATLCATVGFVSEMDILYYPQSAFPHAEKTPLGFERSDTVS
jgi:hypothetical protein